MLAHVHDNVRIRAKPSVEGKVAVWRHEIGRVVRLFRIDVVAARGLYADDHLTEPDHRQCEFITAQGRVVIGSAPAFHHRFANLIRQRGEGPVVGIERDGFANNSPLRHRVRGTFEHAVQKRIAVVRQLGQIVTFAHERAHYLDRSGGRIEPDPVPDAAVPVGVVGKDDRNAPIRRCGWNCRPTAREFGDECDPVRIRFVPYEIALRALVPVARALERDCAR